MRNRRVLILIGLIVVVGAAAVAVFLPSLTGGGEEVAEPTPAATAVPAGMSEIVLSAQEIPREHEITQDAVILQNWPADAVPVGALTSLEDAYGMFARTDIPRGIPVVESMLVADLSEVPQEGSEIAMRIPEGRVAVVLPVKNFTEAGWRYEAGDRVDVLISMLLVELDEDFQSILPNLGGCTSPPAGAECVEGELGRLEVLPDGSVVNVIPSEAQRPRLVTQLTVQDAIVLHAGGWTEAEVREGAPAGEEVEGEETAEAQEAEATPTPQPGGEGAAQPRETTTLQVLTLGVAAQDAAVLQFALLNNAHLSLVLRRTGDTDEILTDPVTLQFLMDRYQIEPPPKLPYGITPPTNNLSSE